MFWCGGGGSGPTEPSPPTAEMPPPAPAEAPRPPADIPPPPPFRPAFGTPRPDGVGKKGDDDDDVVVSLAPVLTQAQRKHNKKLQRMRLLLAELINDGDYVPMHSTAR